MPDGSDLGHAHYEKASASLLSQQPVRVPGYNEIGQEWWDVAYPNLESRLSALRSWRWSWWWAWSDLAAYFLPERYKFFVTANTMTKGQPLNDQIIDSTGALAVIVCAAGMWNGLLNPTRQWFRLQMDPAFRAMTAEEAEWFEHATQMLFTMFARSNYYSVKAQAFQDVTVFGTAPTIMYEDAEDGIRLYNPCAGEYFLGSSARNDNDTLYREYNYTTAQVVGFFGFDKCPQAVQAMWHQGGGALEFEWTIIHSIEPNFAIARPGTNQKPLYIVPPHFPYREVYWIKGQKTAKPLSRRGFHEKPFSVARWKVTSNDPYGRSPAMYCIGDNKQMQQMTLRSNEYVEKLIRPPMTAPPEMKNEPASIMPGMITYTNALQGKPLFSPAFEVNPQSLQPLLAGIEKIGQRVKEALFVPTFMAISQMAGVQPRNEMELTKRDLERLQVLGPFLQLFENEVANPDIMRALAIAERKGIVKPRPQSLRKAPIKIHYDSILRMAQRATKSVAMRDFATTMGVATEAAKTANAPPPARKVNWDKFTERYGQASDLDPDLYYSEDEVKESDLIRKDEAEKAQQRAMAPQMAQVGVNAAKVLTQAPMPNGTALQQLLGQRPDGGTGTPSPGG